MMQFSTFAMLARQGRAIAATLWGPQGMTARVQVLPSFTGNHTFFLFVPGTKTRRFTSWECLANHWIFSVGGTDYLTDAEISL